VLVGMRRLHGVIQHKQMKIKGLGDGGLSGGGETLRRLR